MRRMVTALSLWLALALPGAAQQAAIEDVIRGQLQAFRADDVETAFGFAAPGIQGMFRTPGNFGMMVRNGYPMVWRSQEAEMLALEERDGGLWQRVRITGPQGGTHILDYEMIEQSEGWRIGAVIVLEAPGVAV